MTSNTTTVVLESAAHAVRFTDKVAVVTGAGSGIGRAIAGQLHAEGAQVVAVDINGAGLPELAAELGSERIATVELDVSDGDAIDAFGDEVTRRFGRVDALFNNAGISDEFTPALETSDELWDRVVGINLVGPFRLSRRLLPALLENGGGAIVNTCSVASILGGAGGVAYSVSKHGLLGLTRSLAKDYGSQGVRVNAVLPGATLTGMTSSADAVIEGSDDALAATPAGRWAKPEEVAKVAVFLASDDASFVYGSPYLVDGGWSLS